MPIVALTDITLRTLKPVPGKQVTYIDRGLKGFGVRVAPSGAMTWVVTYGPQRTRMKLGDVGVISLKDARTAARQRLAEHQLGIVPEKGRDTFETALAAFLAASEKRNKPRTVRDYKRLLTRHGFGKTKLTDIKPQMIRKKLDGLVDTPGEQGHAQAALSIFFRYCHRAHYIDADPMVRMQLTKVPSRERVLTTPELKAIWHAANSFPFGTIVRLCILLGQRRSEIGHLRWEWIDQKQKVINLPSDLTKTRKAHTFPFGDLTAEALATIPKQGPLLFPARRNPKDNPDLIYGAWGKDKAELDKKAGVRGWVLHDLRRGLSTTWASLTPTIPLTVTEKYIGHISGSTAGVAGIYNRHTYLPEMREAVLTWELWLHKHIIPV